MEINGDIYSRKDGRKVRYFPSSGPSFNEREMLYSLRSRDRARIIFLLIERGTVAREVALKVRKQKLAQTTQALEDLIKTGIVEENQGRISLIDPEKVISVLKKYRSSFIDSLSSNLISLLK